MLFTELLNKVMTAANGDHVKALDILEKDKEHRQNLIDAVHSFVEWDYLAEHKEDHYCFFISFYNWCSKKYIDLIPCETKKDLVELANSKLEAKYKSFEELRNALGTYGEFYEVFKSRNDLIDWIKEYQDGNEGDELALA